MALSPSSATVRSAVLAVWTVVPMAACGFPEVTFGTPAADGGPSALHPVDAGVNVSARDATSANVDEEGGAVDAAMATGSDADVLIDATAPDATDAGVDGATCVCDAGFFYAENVACGGLLNLVCGTTFGFVGAPGCGEYGQLVHCSAALLGLVGCNVDDAQTEWVAQRCK